MPPQNIISLGFNIEELTAEKKQVLDLFVDMFGKLQAYDGTKFNPLGNGGLVELKKSLVDGATAMNAFGESAAKYNKVVTEQFQKQQAAKKSTDDLTLAEKEHQKTLQTIIATKAKASEADTNAANDKAIELQKLKAINAEVNLSAKAYLSEIGSINEAKATVAQLTSERNKQNAQTKEGAAKILELNAAIDKNNEFIRTNVSLLEKQKINIGNYPGAFKDAYGVLETQLNKIRGDLQNLAPGSAAMAKATEEVSLLDKLLGTLSKEFATTRGESRAFQEAAVALGLALGQDREEFQVFNKAVGDVQNGINDIKAATKFQASDAKLITGLADAASTLAGGFGAAQAASALFGDDNEDLQKQMAKFQQLLVLINGLQAVANGLQAESGGIQLLLSARTSLLNAAKGVQLLLTTRAIQVVSAETASTEINAAAKEANAVATTELSVAQGTQTAAVAANTEATVANSAAQAGAKTATGGLSTALIAGGIAALAIAAGAALALLTAKLIGYGNQSVITTDQQKALAKASGDLNEALNQQARILDDLDVSSKRYYTDLISNAQDAGASQYGLLLVQQEFDKSQADAAKLEVDRLEATDAAYSRQAQRVQQLLSLQQLANEEIKKINAVPEKDQTSSQKKSLEADIKLLDVYSAQLGPEQKRFDDMRNARQKLAEFTQKVLSDETKFNKLSLDEQLAVTEKAEELRANMVKAKNSIILGDDRSTLNQRLAAIKSNATQENAILNAQAQQVKNNPSNFINGLLSPQSQSKIDELNEKRRENLLKSQDDQFKVTVQYNDRELQARAAINRNNLEADAAAQQAITANLNAELDARLGSLKASIDDKTKIILEDYHLQLQLAIEHGKTQDEIDQLQSNKDKALVELTADTQKQIYDITISSGEKRLKAIDDLNKTVNSSGAVSDRYNAEAENLNRSLINGTISYGKYLDERRKLDDQYILDKDHAEIADDQRRLSEVRDYENKKLNIQLAFAQLALSRAKIAGNDKEINDAQAKFDALREIQVKAARNEKAITDKLAKDKQKATEDETAAVIRGNQKIKENTQETEQLTFQLAKTLVDASYENRINQIQQTIDKNNEQADSQVAAIQRSTLSARDQAAEIIIIQANQRAKENELRKEQKKEKIAEAKFDREVAVAEVIWHTAEAIMKDTKGIPWPLSLAVAASDAALGAVQVATILAKPIPTYGDGIGIPGKGEHAGGLAWVAERNKPERVTIPGYEPFIVDRPTLMDLPVKSQVLPLTADNLVFDLGGTAISRGAAIVAGRQDNSGQQIVGAIQNQTVRMERALKKSQKKIINSVHIHVDADWSQYISKKVTGTA